MTLQVDSILASIGWLLGIGLLAAWLARRLDIPDLVLFVLAGIVLGPQVAGLVNLPLSQGVGQLIVTGGAAFMLYEGGRAVDLSVLKRIWLGVGLISLFGVILTAAFVAGAARLFLGVPWIVAVLTGVVVASTDPATIVPLFQSVRVHRRIQQLVVSESAFNDAMGAVLTLTVMGIATTGSFSLGGALVNLGTLVVVGAAVGLGMGFLLQFLVARDTGRHGPLDRHEENGALSPLAITSAYALASGIGGSGFMAVFLAGLVRGNARRWRLYVGDDREATHQSFMDFLSLVVRILIFGVLGASVKIKLLAGLGGAGLLVIGVFIFIARPVTVMICLGLDRIARFSLREILFISWVRETGVVPAALASLLLATGAQGAETVASVTVLAVIVTIVVQAPTTRWWAGKTGVTSGPTDG